MPFCRHCGGQVVGGMAACPHCKKSLASSGGAPKSILLAVVIGCGCFALIGFLGVVSAILIPNLLDALQKARQKRTMVDTRALGNAMMSWLVDQVGAPQSSTGGLPEYPTAEELSAILVPDYIGSVPEVDGWKNPFRFWVNPNLLDTAVLRIESAGRDAVFSPENYLDADGYQPAAFLLTDYDQDIVWADGYFLHWPTGYGRGE